MYCNDFFDASQWESVGYGRTHWTRTREAPTEHFDVSGGSVHLIPLPYHLPGTLFFLHLILDVAAFSMAFRIHGYDAATR